LHEQKARLAPLGFLKGDPNDNDDQRSESQTSFQQANLMGRVLTFEDIVTIIDTVTPKPGARGPYKKNSA
jgi:hypothetical protein